MSDDVLPVVMWGFINRYEEKKRKGSVVMKSLGPKRLFLFFGDLCRGMIMNPTH